MRKKMWKGLSVAAVVVAAAAVLVAGCGGSGSQGTETAGDGGPGGQVTAPDRVFTVQELAQFDGKDGRPAYVAVDGVVYDVTGSSMWPQGSHTSCPGSVAGRDLSEVIRTAPPRMRTYMQGFPVVGTLQ